MVRRRFRVDRCEAERRVRAASGLRLVCGSSMVWPHLLHTSASVRRMPWHTHIMAHLRGDPHTVHRAPCTWHTHIMYLAHPYCGTTYTPFRRPVQTPRSDAPARTAPHTKMPGVPETPPAPPAPHTLPRTHLWRSEGGARCGRVSVKARRCGLHVPRDGSGEPARA